MISIFILVGFCLIAADAKPNPVVGSYVVDGVQGVLYEVPEYEDPELALLQLSAMGVMPVLTVLQDPDTEDGEDAPCMEEFSDVKKGLDGIIVGLEAARGKFEEGSTDIEKDIGKSVTHLMKLKHHLKTHINYAPSANHESSASDDMDGHHRIPQAGKYFTQVTTSTKSSMDDIASLMTIADAIMVSESGEKSVSGFLKFKQPMHRLNDPLTLNDLETSETDEDDHDSILELGKVSTESPTPSSEKSDTKDGKHELVAIKTEGEGFMISEKNKYQDVGKALFHKKWSMKPSKDE